MGYWGGEEGCGVGVQEFGEAGVEGLEALACACGGGLGGLWACLRVGVRF